MNLCCFLCDDFQTIDYSSRFYTVRRRAHMIGYCIVPARRRNLAGLIDMCRCGRPRRPAPKRTRVGIKKRPQEAAKRLWDPRRRETYNQPDERYHDIDRWKRRRRQQPSPRTQAVAPALSEKEEVVKIIYLKRVAQKTLQLRASGKLAKISQKRSANDGGVPGREAASVKTDPGPRD